MEEEADGLSQPLWQMQPGKEAPRRPSLEAFELLVDWRTEIGKGFLRFCFFSKNSLLDSKRTLFFAPNNALTLFFRLETKIKKEGREGTGAPVFGAARLACSLSPPSRSFPSHDGQL